MDDKPKPKRTEGEQKEFVSRVIKELLERCAMNERRTDGHSLN